MDEPSQSDAAAMTAVLAGFIGGCLKSQEGHMLRAPVSVLDWDPSGTVRAQLASGLLVTIHIEVKLP